VKYIGQKDMENLTQLSENCSQSYADLNVAVTGAAVAGVSLLACLFALFIIILFKKWQLFGQRLIAYLIISATLLSVALVMRIVDFDEDFTPADVRFCAFSGFAIQITIWNLVDSMVAITVYLFLGVVCDRVTDKYEWLYVLFIFVVPLVFGWIPFIHNTYGQAGVWCWIELVDYTTCERLLFGHVLQLAMFYVPLFIILPSINLMYLIILCKLSRNRKHKSIARGQSDKILKLETARLLAYPLIFFLLTLPTLAVRIQDWIDPEHRVLALMYLSVVTANLEGTAISLAFLLLNRDTRSQLKWTHMRAAFRNYNNMKGISEYVTDGATEEEAEVESEFSVPYKRLTDDSFVQESGTTTTK
jgi:hypothetical protein